MKLVSMKKDKAQSTDAVCVGTSEYPYGLKIELSEESLKKLGLELPRMESKFSLQAVVEVCSVSTFVDEFSERATVSLQIQEMGLTPMKAGVESFYGKKETKEKE